MRLSQPITIGNLKLKNRLIFPAFETNWSTDRGNVTPELVRFWKVMAAGGCSLIIVQATSVNPDVVHKHTPFITCLHDDSYIKEYGKAVAEVKKTQPDIRMGIQLVDKSLMGRHITPKDLTIGEIEAIVEYHAQAARRAQEAGFDAVEYHAAHGYTMANFLSRRSNDRPMKDPYGRTEAGRMRLQREIIARTRDLGVGIPIIYRYSGDEFCVGGNTIRNGVKIAEELEKIGVDSISVSAGGNRAEGMDSYSTSRCVPAAHYEDACNAHIAEAIKRHVSIPVMAAGKIGTIALAEQLLADGKADIIAMARQLFCDPFTLQKTMEGRERDILRCTWCRNCHISYLSNGIAFCRHKEWQRVYLAKPITHRAA